MCVDTTVITRDNVELSVREHGSPSAAHTVVLLHGFCLDKSSWALQVDALESRYGGDVRVISYDHRGHGLSQRSGMSTYSIDQLARDLSDVMEAMNVRGHVTLAGHSMGGMTMLRYMGMEDRSVDPESLVLVATAAGKLARRGVGVLLASPAVTALWHSVNTVPDRLLEPVVRKVSAPIIHGLINHAAYPVGGCDAQVTATSWSINATSLRTKVGFMNALRTYDAYDVLERIGSMTTILSGGRDFLTPREHSDDMALRIPGAKHLHFPSAGHMLLHEVPDAVTSALETFAVSRAFA